MTIFDWLRGLLIVVEDEFSGAGREEVYYIDEEEDDEMAYYDDEIDLGINDDDFVYLRITNEEDEIDRAISMSPSYARTLANRLLMLADTVEKVPYTVTNKSSPNPAPRAPDHLG